MKRSVLVALSLLALAACTLQPPSRPGSGTQPPIPAAYAAGSPGNTTSGFDGTYTDGAIQNIRKGNELVIAGGSAPIVCPEYGIPPPLAIVHGLAQFQLLNHTFQGYVTPQGHLEMDSGYGQTLEGQIDDQGVLRAHGLGGCTYDATWIRKI